MPLERNLTPKEARNYMEEAAKKLLGISSEEEFWKLLRDRGRYLISSLSPEEKEPLYRAVANRLYYSFFQFFRWYEWDEDRRRGVNHEETVRRRTNHGSLQREVAQKMAHTLVRLFEGDFNMRRIKRDIFQWIDKLRSCRSHADYKTEEEFQDEDFQNLLEAYLYFRLAMVWL